METTKSTMPSSSKKYKLFSKSEDTGGKAVCAFFKSPDGCRNGDKCKFLHGDPDTKSSVAHQVSETASVVSSEESEAETERAPVKGKKKASTPTEKKRKAVSSGDIFSNQKSDPRPKKQPRKADPTPTKSPEQPAAQRSFESLLAALPVASFSIPNGTATPKKKEAAAHSLKSEPTKHDNMQTSKYPLPVPTGAGNFWVRGVQHSQKHEKFESSLDFNKYMEANGTGSEWIKAKKFGQWCENNPQAIAIDCEMCETQDPLSGTKNAKALCRLSVVNAMNPDEVLLDTLVKPVWPVTDYRTRINGIAKNDLDNVAFTLRHAQAFMMALCSDQTVIIGHAIHNDLIALNMEHYCVADSVFLFTAKDTPNASVSLKDLVSSVFQKQMPDTHDSVNDAKMALGCVRHWVEKGGKVDEIERSVKKRADELFIHRIPKQCKVEHITAMFLKHTSVEPSKVDQIEFSGETGRTQVTFRSIRHANLAFDCLESPAEQDKSGRLQKKVYLRDGDYVRVRKMTHAKHSTPQKPSKQS